MTRSAAAFLAQTEWADARRSPLAGDASARRYERLHLGGRTAVLMDAPPTSGEDIRPFTKIARHLTGLGFSTPAILAEDPAQGFLLLEDFGDALLARLTAQDPACQTPLYTVATDVLIALHQSPPPDGIEAFKPNVMMDQVAPLWDWYVGQGVAQPELAAQFSTLFQPILHQHADDQSVMIIRDYHAENLIHLPNRSGVRQMGLLDFQDAKAAQPAYDLVSLLQDARRDVPEALERSMIDHYLAKSSRNRDDFETSYAVLGLQRNLRILGVLTRLCLHLGKAHYVDFLPRVWGYVQRNLANPVHSSLRPILAELPAPTAEFCQDLKDRAATCPDL